MILPPARLPSFTNLQILVESSSVSAEYAGKVCTKRRERPSSLKAFQGIKMVLDLNGHSDNLGHAFAESRNTQKQER